MKDFMLTPNYDEDTKNKFNLVKGKMTLTPTNLDYYTQKIRACLSFQLGEYFTDSTIGLPYIPDFGMSKTEVTIETNEHIEIDGNDYIRQSGIVHGEKYGQEGTAYFTVYYGISDVNYATFNGEKVYDPFMVIAFTGDLSDEGRQIVNDSADYSMTHSYLLSE